MIYGSLCSGIEAASLAWEPLGWTLAYFAEVEPFPSAVLHHHWPNVPNLGDMTADDFIDRAAQHGPVDVLVSGTPCQSFSVAGLRGGLDDERGNLALQFCRVVDRCRPRWIVWENVPGVLSVNKGRDFGTIVGSFSKLGYNLAWRILCAEHFGVPQRRRRVFLVGHLGADERGAGAVLFERHSVQGHPAPSRETRQGVATNSPSGSHWTGANIHPTLLRSAKKNGPIGFSDQEIFSQKGAGLVGTARMLAIGEYVDDNTASTIAHRDYKSATDLICVNARETPVSASGKSLPLGAQDRGHAVATQMQVRRLTPRECERLQGMPDDHTRIPWRGKPSEDCPDTPRYKAIGNSMAVPVMRWIGERIQMVDALLTD